MNEVEEIKSRLNIVDVIGSYIKLEKAGINYRACCPFHSEKTPSFFVSPTRQIWHCFGGCNEGGDIFKFVMKIENIEFSDALKILAARAGVSLKPQMGGEFEKMKSERQLLLDICELATRFFEAYLKKSVKGKEANEYLLKRGLKPETIKLWRLGYAPEAWSKLSDFLVGQGYKRADIVRAGLAIEKDEHKFFDRFRSRIMFPICGFNGEVIGFTGRIFGEADDNEAKYLNTPNTLLYDKSKALFGIDKAKLEIRKNNTCILVEGNVDCIMSHQAGFANCLAVSGTALTQLHLNIIKRYCSNLILAFDMDEAGHKATKKAAEIATQMDFNIKVVPLVNEKDPADIILYDGEEKWKQMVENAQPINEFYYNLALQNRDVNNLEDKKKIITDLLPFFKKINNAVEQSHWLNKLSATLRVREEDLRKDMEKIKDDYSPAYPIIEDRVEPVVQKQKTRQDLLEEQIAVFILLSRENVNLLPLDLVNNFSEPTRDILLKIIANPQITNDELIDSLKNTPATIDFLNYLILKSEVEAEIDDLPKELEKCVIERHNLINKSIRQELAFRIKESEAKGDWEAIPKLLEEFNLLTKNNKNNNEKENFEKQALEEKKDIAQKDEESEEHEKEEGCSEEECYTEEVD